MHRYKKSRYLCRSFFRCTDYSLINDLAPLHTFYYYNQLKTYAIQSKNSFTFTPAAEPLLQHCNNLSDRHIPNADAGATVCRAASKETADNKLV